VCVCLCLGVSKGVRPFPYCSCKCVSVQGDLQTACTPTPSLYLIVGEVPDFVAKKVDVHAVATLVKVCVFLAFFPPLVSWLSKLCACVFVENGKALTFVFVLLGSSFFASFPNPCLLLIVTVTF